MDGEMLSSEAREACRRPRPVGGSQTTAIQMQTNTTMVGVRTREGRRISNGTDPAHTRSLHMNNQLFK
ncbi:unnamed protein product [Leptosia nina]|uniref:Uncharacterized protein n=1 Tax=Leptosia nina TaxID=320188 RepID=A0AAV1K6F7_9NEOP